MKTEIYENYEAFLLREDKSINGVSPEFAQANPAWDAERGNKGCWNCTECAVCTDCADCTVCADCARCTGCADCARCTDCADCANCARCADCAGCARCDDCAGKKETVVCPVINGIHNAVLSAASGKNALNMKAWHTCATTHCRAGWVVHLAGDAGRELEAKTSTLFAAMMIYKASSPIRVAPTQFFVTNEEAMEDMRRCAEEEAKLNN